MQLRKQAEVELGGKIRELREELGACQESKRKLEGTVGVVFDSICYMLLGRCLTN